MKSAALTLFLAFSTQAFAATYDLSMNLAVNGARVSSPRLIVQEGKTATIIQKSEAAKNFIEVVALGEDGPDAKNVLLKFKIGTIAENGERKVLSTPQILAAIDEKAQVNVNSSVDGKANDLMFTVIAKKAQ